LLFWYFSKTDCPNSRPGKISTSTSKKYFFINMFFKLYKNTD
jgi:hypothetical protein